MDTRERVGDTLLSEVRRVLWVLCACVYWRVFVLSVMGYRFWCSLCRYLSAYPRPALVTFLTSAPVLQLLVTVIFAPS